MRLQRRRGRLRGALACSTGRQKSPDDTLRGPVGLGARANQPDNWLMILNFSIVPECLQLSAPLRFQLFSPRRPVSAVSRGRLDVRPASRVYIQADARGRQLQPGRPVGWRPLARRAKLKSIRTPRRRHLGRPGGAAGRPARMIPHKPARARLVGLRAGEQNLSHCGGVAARESCRPFQWARRAGRAVQHFHSLAPFALSAWLNVAEPPAEHQPQHPVGRLAGGILCRAGDPRSPGAPMKHECK